MDNFDFNEVEKYLRNGGNAGEIAKAFADKINATLASIDAEKKAITEQAEAVADAWNDYVTAYFDIHGVPKHTLVEDWMLAGEDIEKVMKTIVSVCDSYKKYDDVINRIVKPQSDIINTFFKKNNI